MEWTYLVEAPHGDPQSAYLLFFCQLDFDSLTDCTYSISRSRSSTNCSEAVRLRTDRRTDPVVSQPSRKRTEASLLTRLGLSLE
jgi:hypothetical protein